MGAVLGHGGWRHNFTAAMDLVFTLLPALESLRPRRERSLLVSLPVRVVTSWWRPEVAPCFQRPVCGAIPEQKLVVLGSKLRISSEHMDTVSGTSQESAGGGDQILCAPASLAVKYALSSTSSSRDCAQSMHRTTMSASR